MAVLHVAYTFQPQSFLARLQREVIVAGKLHYDSLLAWASTVVTESSDVRQKALEMVRFGPELLANARSDPKEYTGELLMVALVGALTPVTSLSTRQRESYYVLRKILPLLGWDKETIDRLIHGDSLDTLIQLSQDAVLIGEFCDLRQYGGWLDHSAVMKLSQAITSVAHEFLHPREHLIRSLAETAQLLSVPTSALLERAYFDATGMLLNVTEETMALFVVLD